MAVASSFPRNFRRIDCGDMYCVYFLYISCTTIPIGRQFGQHRNERMTLVFAKPEAMLNKYVIRADAAAALARHIRGCAGAGIGVMNGNEAQMPRMRWDG